MPRNKVDNLSEEISAELDIRITEMKRQALVLVVQSKPETRLLDVVALAEKLGLGRDITLGDLQGSRVGEPMAAPARKALPSSPRRKARSPGILGDQREEIKNSIIRVLRKQKRPVGARDLRIAINHPNLSKGIMTNIMRELVAEHSVAYEGNTSAREYYALS